jgi:hypothetical protein
MAFDKKEEQPASTVDEAGVPRRSFLKYLGASFGAAALPEVLTACTGEVGTLTANGEDGQELVATTQIEVVRPSDLVCLTIGFVNLHRDGTTGRLVKDAPGKSYLIVDFPPQAFLEDAYLPPVLAGRTTPPEIAAIKMSGSSRVVFELPPGATSEEYTLTNLLRLCSASRMVLADAAKPASPVIPVTTTASAAPTSSSTSTTMAASRGVDRALAGVDPASARRLMTLKQLELVTAPGATATNPDPPPFTDNSVTLLEIPYRLQISPNSMAAWGHAKDPVYNADTNRTELWHSYLGVRDPDSGKVDEKSAYLRTIRALSTRDIDVQDDVPTTSPTPPVPRKEVVKLESLYPSHRRAIVRATTTSPDARPVQVNRLMMSALGAHFDVRGEFPESSPEVRLWIHKMTGGRENYVKIVSDGYVFPFGHKATNIQITKRNDNPNDGPIGVLLTFNILIIQNPVVSYRPEEYAAATRPSLNEWPFLAVELKKTHFIINRIEPVSGVIRGWANDFSNRKIIVPVVGYDQRGKPITFETPLYFVTGLRSANAAQFTSNFHDDASADSFTYDMHGQRIAYAPSQTDDTTFETQSLRMQLRAVTDAAYNVVPVVADTIMANEAVRHLTGVGSAKYEYDRDFKQFGVDPAVGKNPGQMIFALKEPKFIDVDFGGKKDGSTGFLQPNMRFTGLSKKTGPATSPGTATASSLPGRTILAPTEPVGPGGFDPIAMFKDALGDSLLFGAFNLLDIIQAVGGKDVVDELAKDALRYAPKFITEAYHEAERVIAAVNALMQTLDTLHSHAKDVVGKAEEIEKNISNIPAEAQAAVSAYLADVKARLLAVRAAAEVVFHNAERVFEDLRTGAMQPLVGIPPRTDGKPTDVKALLDSITAGTPEDSPAGDSRPAGLLKRISDLAALQPTDVAKPYIAKAAGIVQGIRSEVDDRVKQVQGYLNDANKLVTLLNQVEQGIEMARSLKIRLEWRPKIKQWLCFYPASEQGLLLALDVRAKAEEGKQAGTDLLCRLDRFDLRLGGDTDDDAELTLKFEHIQIKKDAGKKIDVDVVFDRIHFGGELKFIETLRTLIPLDGFSDPPYLDIDESGIKAGFTLSIPNIAIGMFSLENIKVAAELSVPFIGTSPLSFTFSFCERDHPFLVTVSMLGGGGYFTMTVTPKGLQHLEASIDVCAQLSINLGVAAGAVSISAGFTIELNADKDGHMHARITGWLRLFGMVEILGIITISIELKMSLSYEDGKVTGRASLIVEIEVAFFSKSVEISFERKFAGSNGDPTLRELMSPYTMSAADALDAHARQVDPWQDYCLAFG